MGRSWTFEAWRRIQSSRAAGIGHNQSFMAVSLDFRLIRKVDIQVF